MGGKKAFQRKTSGYKGPEAEGMRHIEKLEEGQYGRCVGSSIGDESEELGRVPGEGEGSRDLGLVLKDTI